MHRLGGGLAEVDGNAEHRPRKRDNNSQQADAREEQSSEESSSEHTVCPPNSSSSAVETKHSDRERPSPAVVIAHEAGLHLKLFCPGQDGQQQLDHRHQRCQAPGQRQPRNALDRRPKNANASVQGSFDASGQCERKSGDAAAHQQNDGRLCESGTA